MFQLSRIKFKKHDLKKILLFYPKSIGVRRSSFATAVFDDNEHIHRSLIPTDHFQDSLPRLSIPPIEKSCDRYLRALKVVATGEQYDSALAEFFKFKNSDCSELDRLVRKQDKENKHTSYITDIWYNLYLNDRRPVVLTHSPFMMFSDIPDDSINRDQMIKATNMIVSSVRFLKTYRDNILTPDVFHLKPEVSDTPRFQKFCARLPRKFAWYGAYWYNAYPLDMSQFARLFNSTRIPRTRTDELFTDASAHHLLVMRNGHFFTFDVFHADGTIKSASEIFAYLKYIDSLGTEAPEYPIGILSSTDRDSWTKLREELVSCGNEETLRQIDSAVFCLNLDDSIPDTQEECAPIFLHGKGYDRWFDKSFSLIITKNGKAAVNFEHSWGDGVAVLRYFNEVFKDVCDRPTCQPSTVPATNVKPEDDVKRLKFKLNSTLKEGIKFAQKRFDTAKSNLVIRDLQTDVLNKQILKSHGLSHDSVMQLSFQLAYFRQKATFVPTYESAATAAFKHGRTECLRAATEYTKNFCLALHKPSGVLPAATDLRNMMLDCSDYHNQLTKEAVMGQGFDRYFLALQTMANACSFDIEIFQKDWWLMMNKFILSTSTLASPAVSFGAFAAVQPNGYGIGYGIREEGCGAVVSGYEPAVNVREFLDALDSAFNDIRKVLDEAPNKDDEDDQ